MKEIEMNEPVMMCMAYTKIDRNHFSLKISVSYDGINNEQIGIIKFYDTEEALLEYYSKFHITKI